MYFFGKFTFIIIFATISNAYIVTSVNFIFETFSPYGMIRFFEFNDKGWNVSVNCLKDMYQFLGGLQKGSVWAVKLYDSTGYYGGGAYGGNKFRLGNPDQCRELQEEYMSTLRMHWNLRINTTSIPFPVHLIAAKFQVEMAAKYHDIYTIQQSVCFPKSCNIVDLEQIFTANLVQSNHIVRNVSLLEIRLVEGLYNFIEDASCFVLLSILIIAVILIICAHFSDSWSFLHEDICDPTTCTDSKEDSSSSLPSRLSNNEVQCALEQLSKTSNCDKNTLSNLNLNPLISTATINNINPTKHVNLLKVKKFNPKNVATLNLDILRGSCDYEKPVKIRDDSTIVRNLLNAFSLPSNFYGLIERTDYENEIAAVRGLQVFCTVLMMLAYTAAILNFVSINQNIKQISNLNFLILAKTQGSYLVDTFFFLSGTNLAHLYFKTNCKEATHFLEQILHFLGMIAHKICSIILPYIIVLICLELSSKHFYDNSVLSLPSYDHQTCENTKWRNILYIDTFFPLEERCMPWSWYISVDVQLFIAACLILLLAQIHPKYAGAICAAVFVSSIVASTFLELEMDGFFEWRKPQLRELMDFNLIFGKIWLRIPPYLLGMCLGYTLYKTEGKLQMNIFVVVFGWLACFLIILGFIFGYQLVFIRLNPWIRAGVITLAHTIWSMMMFWVILASISQYGGLLQKLLTSRLFNVLGKLTTCALLVGPLVIRVVVQSAETGIKFTNGFLFISFIGFTFLTYLIAFVLHILFEAPLMVVLNVIYQHRLK